MKPDIGLSELRRSSDDATPRSGDVDLAWRQFAAADTPEAFCRNWLALQCHRIGAVNDAVVVLQKPGTQSFAPLAYWPEARRDRTQLSEVGDSALRSGRGVVQPRSSPAGGSVPERPDYQMAYPVRLDGEVRGVVVLDLAWRDEAALQAAMRQLQWGAGWLEVLLRRHADPMEYLRQRLKLVLQFVSVFLERADLQGAATALVTEVAAQLGCDRVVLGLMRGRKIRIEAVSNTVQFDRHANLMRCTEQAMLEALDQGEPVVHPADRDDRLVVTFAHAELLQLSAAGGVATFPLLHDGRPVGALTLERAPGYPFDAPVVELLAGLAALLGPLLDLRRAQHRSLPAHVAEAAGGLWQRLVGPGHAAFKFFALLLAGVALFLALVEGDYRASANVRVEGEVQRAVTAPFQGYVLETSRRAGDTVAKGEVLARLDDRDLRLERIRLIAQRDQLVKQQREAMSSRDRARMLVLGSQIDQAEAQLALVEEKLARTRIVAPFDGVLISGDLTQSLGAPLERGQVLFEVAPLDAYRVVLQVDEHDVSDVRIGQHGALVLQSMPENRYAFTVTKITPVTTAKDGRNFFRAEAKLDAAQGAPLRPGMEGVAKIEIDRRLLIRIWARELVNWVRLKAWAWLP